MTAEPEQAASIFEREAPSPSGFCMDDDEQDEDPADLFALGLMEGAEPETAASPTNAPAVKPRKSSDLREAALSRGQTRLTSWIQQRPPETPASWLQDQQPAPIRTEPVDFEVFTGARAPT
eukprot:2438343-Rhodomonas_salina.1